MLMYPVEDHEKTLTISSKIRKKLSTSHKKKRVREISVEQESSVYTFYLFILSYVQTTNYHDLNKKPIKQLNNRLFIFTIHISK